MSRIGNALTSVNPQWDPFNPKEMYYQTSRTAPQDPNFLIT
jgi:hypothetical protein